MAVINPPGFLQNVGATHTAEQTRNWIGSIPYAGSASSGSLLPRGGVARGRAFGLSVTQTGSPSMAVIVRAGMAVVPGSEGAKQGGYDVLNDADVTLSITAAHATLNRIDLVCFKVEDQVYSGAVNTSSLVVVTGTPSGSPVAPSAPNNSLTLGQVTVNAAVTSIVNANITDKRVWLAGHGGIIICTSSTRPAAGTVETGQFIYEVDTAVLRVTTDTGATWDQMSARNERQVWSVYVPAWTSSGTTPSLGNGSITGHWLNIAKTVYVMVRIIWGSTTNGGTGVWKISLPAQSNNDEIYMGGFAWDNSASLVLPCASRIDSGATSQLDQIGTHGSTGTAGLITATVPFTWAVSDELSLQGLYEAL